LTKESAKISRVNGTHEGLNEINDVLGFSARDKTIQFFPTGLDKVFKNLKLIRIEYCKLKEIHQSNLKGFSNLVYFFSHSNEIEIIEEGLFDYNLNLQLVGFYESGIIHIDPNVFDHLTKLRYFWLTYVPCINQDINNARAQVQKIIKIVKSECSNSEYLSIENQIKNLKIEPKVYLI